MIQENTQKVQNAHRGKANTTTHECTRYLLQCVPMRTETHALTPHTHTHSFTTKGKTTPTTLSDDSYEGLPRIYSSIHHTLSLQNCSPLLPLCVPLTLSLPAIVLPRLVFHLSQRKNEASVWQYSLYWYCEVKALAHKHRCRQKCTVRCKHTCRTIVSMVSGALWIILPHCEKWGRKIDRAGERQRARTNGGKVREVMKGI